MDIKQGIVIKSTGSWYNVETSEGELYDCKLRGQFRIKGIKTTNPIAVGDRVDFQMSKDESTSIITKIHPRENYIIRKATKLSKQSHIIAANMDQAIVIVTLAYPRTSTGFIDRFLVTSEAYHIPACIVFNKIDLYDEEMKNDLDQMCEYYTSLGYTTMTVSAKTGEHVEEFKSLIQDKTSLVTGHSGVGKSALVNKVAPGLDLRVGDISEYHFKGKHTTTFAQMFKLPFGGRIIDTPGIKEFGLLDFDKEEVGGRFPEFRSRMHNCHFNNCKHIQEPKCAVKEAVEEGEIAFWRYENYLNIMAGEDLNKDFWKS